ncbi:uncharacterized protein [Rutidosis leptorrhynchoides]|uniref:uncharacterized protein isoform X2 n=1 Tax=Rutidosis leptorrhynchoides TaxID=125765 RepID=UPI003A9927CB
MKFEELIMQETQEKQTTMDLQHQVEQLEEELEDELKLSKILQYALDGPIHLCCPCLSAQTNLPFKIKELLTELATVEDEIKWLEKKVEKLNLNLYLEKKYTREWELQHLKSLYPNRHHRPRKQSLRRHQNRSKLMGSEQDLHKRRSSFGSSVDTKYDKLQLSVSDTKNPNKLSEDLIQCLIAIFLKLYQPLLDGEEMLPKQISCKSFISKSTFNCTAPTFFFNNNGSRYLDPYATLLDFDGGIRDIGPYKTFTQITRNTLDHTRISECSKEVGKLCIMMQKLCSVNLNLLTYKQKLAFWINVYNACIMHAFLQHGLPSTQEKLLVLMNKAVINVGGIVVNALGIEHFILRHPSSSNHLRVYTSEDIVNELARARVEYLEASVGVVSRKKVLVPKLLQCHIKDFADDMESLLEWIYSQLPQSGSLRRLIMECLNDETKSSLAKMVEIQPYVYEFRYLLPS